MIDRCVRNGVTCPSCQDRLRSRVHGFVCSLCGASGEKVKTGGRGGGYRWDYKPKPNAPAELAAAYRVGGMDAVDILRGVAV